MQQQQKRGKKFIAVLCCIIAFLILDLVVWYVQKDQSPRFATPQEVAEYVYKEEPEAIIFGKDSCFIFNRFFDRKAEYMISPCIDGKYEIGTRVRPNLIAGKAKIIRYIDFLQGEGSNDRYIVVVGRGYPSEINIYDNSGTDFHLFFYEEQVEGTELAPYFWAVGYLDSGRLSSYTVTVCDSNTSESISTKRQENGTFALAD